MLHGLPDSRWRNKIVGAIIPVLLQDHVYYHRVLCCHVTNAHVKSNNIAEASRSFAHKTIEGYPAPKTISKQPPGIPQPQAPPISPKGNHLEAFPQNPPNPNPRNFLQRVKLFRSIQKSSNPNPPNFPKDPLKLFRSTQLGQPQTKRRKAARSLAHHTIEGYPTPKPKRRHLTP